MKFLFRYNILILLAIFTVMALFSVQLGMVRLRGGKQINEVILIC